MTPRTLPATAAAVALALAVATPAADAAARSPLERDLAVAVDTLPAGHPCRTGVLVEWQRDMLGFDGRPIWSAPVGVETDTRGTIDPTDDALTLRSCTIAIDPRAWATMTRCEQRRDVIHEVRYLTPLPATRGGIGDPDPDARDHVPVPGCPALRRPSLVDRAESRLLAALPAGTAVSCAPARRGTARCSATVGHKTRYYTVRPDPTGAHMTLRRTRETTP
jgi:hypothetical protein